MLPNIQAKNSIKKNVKRFLLLPILLLCILLNQFGCAPKSPQSQDEEASYTEAWIYGPKSLIQELSQGKQIQVDPSVQDFPIFNTKKAAKEALTSGIAKQQLPPTGWAYFRLAGNYADLVTWRGQQAVLKEPTHLVDWAWADSH